MQTDQCEYDDKLTDEVKVLAHKLGAEMVGVGPVERWKHAPLMLSPQGLLPSSKSVVAICITFIDASMELTEKEMSENWYNPYDMCENLTGMNERLDSIAFNLAKFLENKGYKSLYTPVSNLWRIKPYKSIDHPFAPALVHRYAAVACGLGEIGWSGLFLSPEHGSRQRIIPVVTEAPLTPTPMYDGPRLCNKCMECVKRCPLDCFRKEVKKINKLDIGGKIFEFPDINKWRCSLDYYGISGPFVPEKITEEVALKIAHSDVRPRKSIMDSGACLCSCVPPSLRFKDEKYPRGIRRKNPRKPADPVEVTNALREIARMNGIDHMGITVESELAEKGIRIGEYLPEAAAALIIGIGWDSDSMKGAVTSRLKKTIFELSHALQNLGYAVLPIPRLPVESLVGYFGFKTENCNYFHLLTEFPLLPLNFSPAEEKTAKRNITATEIKAFAASKGADLTGIASVDRLNKMHSKLQDIYRGEKNIQITAPWIPGGVTGTVESVALEDVIIRKPEDHLPGARSVIVVGIHFPATLLERVAKPPAENIASYAGGTQGWGVQQELLSTVFDLVQFLKRSGYRAEVVSDLFGTDCGAKAWMPCDGVATSRFAAVCAGLGELGRSGAILTPEYGLNQRFISIVTDAELEEDSLYQGAPLCKKCGRCAAVCPVDALSDKEMIQIEIDGKRIEFGKRDRLRCQWSVKCGLVKSEGPEYLGVTKDFQPPRDITAEAVCNALQQLNPAEWTWSATFEKCLSVCPTTEEVLTAKRRNNIEHISQP